MPDDGFRDGGRKHALHVGEHHGAFHQFRVKELSTPAASNWIQRNCRAARKSSWLRPPKTMWASATS